MRVITTSFVASSGVLTALLLTACGASGTAATVGEETIAISDVQGEVVAFSESFDEPLPIDGDLSTVQSEFLTRQINHLLITELADREGVVVIPAEVDELYDELAAGGEEELDSLRAQFVYTEDGLRRALEDELRIRALAPIVGDVQSAVEDVAEDVGVDVNPRYGVWFGIQVVPSTGSISVPAG